MLPDAIVGHRGARAVRPENSLDGFTYAVSVGVQAVELDVRLSRDEVLVCSHDPSPARLGGPADLVVEMTADTLGQLRLKGGVGIPRLDQVLDVLARDVGVIIEIKNDPSEPDFRADRRTAVVLAEMLDARRTRIRNVSSFDHESASVFASARPDLGQVVALLAAPGVSASQTLAEVQHRGMRHMHVHYLSAVRRPDTVRAAGDAEVAVSCYTVNSIVVARRLLRFGVTSIITDDPVRVAAACATH